MLEPALRAAPERFAWRIDTCKFVGTPIAIDLLWGAAEARVSLESQVRPRDLVDRRKTELDEWCERRAKCLLP